MSKFWGFSAIIIIIGVLAVLTAGDREEINFTDLETECREDRGETHQITLDENNQLQFSGYIPLQSTQADMDYEYYKSNNKMLLNLQSMDQNPPEDFANSCYASGIYNAETRELKGKYTVVLEHNGEEIDTQVINFN